MKYAVSHKKIYELPAATTQRKTTEIAIAGIHPLQYTRVITYIICNFSFLFSIHVLATEFVGPSKRTIAGMGVNYTFSIGYMLLALLAYFIRDWWILELVVSAPMILLFLLIP